jgi:hypothetical protein
MAVRAKLAVSEPGDAVEREADAIANRVMRMPEPATTPVSGAPAAGAKAEQVKRLAQRDEKKPATADGQAPAASTASAAAPGATQKATQKATPTAPAPAATQVPAQVPTLDPGAGAGYPDAKPGSRPRRHDRQTPGGQHGASGPPATASRRLATLPERRPKCCRASVPATLSMPTAGLSSSSDWGVIWGDVRIHADDSAGEAARLLRARAFTWGNHIAFAGGEYQPATASGRTLLAHELAHVLQNDSMVVSNVVRRKPDDPRYKDGNDISSEAIDPAKDKKARPALETLKLPAIKARHADVYQKLAGKSLRRPKGYDRKNAALPDRTGQEMEGSD